MATGRDKIKGLETEVQACQWVELEVNAFLEELAKLR